MLRPLRAWPPTATLFVLVALCTANAAQAAEAEPSSGGLRGAPPALVSAQNASTPTRLEAVLPAPVLPPTLAPVGPAVSVNQSAPNRLDVDIWVETWFSRAIDIHKVLPDGEREGQAHVTRMYYNLSVEVYAKDASRPFHYAIWVGDMKVMEGDATWKLHWVTSVQQDLFNISVEVTQDGKTRRAEWARILGVPGEDAGIGGQGGQDPTVGPTTQEVPIGFIDKLTWKLIGAALAQMIAAFMIVGGFYLERAERMGWTRFR